MNEIKLTEEQKSKLLEKIPTHFKFKDKKEASFWDCTTKVWIPISEIQIESDNCFFIASSTFAWVSYNPLNKNLLFKNDKFTKNI